MQPCPESGVDNFLAEVISHIEVPYRVQVPGRSGGVEPVNIEVDFICSEEGAEHLGHRRRDKSMRGGIFRMVRRSEERPPARPLDGSRITIVITRHGTEPSFVTAVGSSDPLIAVTGRQNK